MRSPAVAVLAAAFLVVAATLPAACRAEWVAVPDVHGDLVIRQVAQFSVLVYGLAHRKDVRFVDVVSGETEEAVGGGTNYKLVVVAAKADDGKTAEYECLVWGVPGSRSDTWKLRRFRKIHSAKLAAADA